MSVCNRGNTQDISMQQRQSQCESEPRINLKDHLQSDEINYLKYVSIAPRFTANEFEEWLEDIDTESSFNDDGIPPSEKELFSSDWDEADVCDYVPPTTRMKKQLVEQLMENVIGEDDGECSFAAKQKSRDNAIRSFRNFLRKRRAILAYKRLKKLEDANLQDPEKESFFLEKLELVDKKLNRPFYYECQEPSTYKRLLKKRKKAIRRKYELYAMDREYRDELHRRTLACVKNIIPDDKQTIQRGDQKIKINKKSLDRSQAVSEARGSVGRSLERSQQLSETKGSLQRSLGLGLERSQEPCVSGSPERSLGQTYDRTQTISEGRSSQGRSLERSLGQTYDRTQTISEGRSSLGRSLERSQQISQAIGSPQRSLGQSLERSQEVCEVSGSPERSLGRTFERSQRISEGRGSLGQSQEICDARGSPGRSLERSQQLCEARGSPERSPQRSLGQSLERSQELCEVSGSPERSLGRLFERSQRISEGRDSLGQNQEVCDARGSPRRSLERSQQLCEARGSPERSPQRSLGQGLERSQELCEVSGSPERSLGRSFERSQRISEGRGSLGQSQQVCDARGSLERSRDQSQQLCEARGSPERCLQRSQELCKVSGSPERSLGRTFDRTQTISEGRGSLGRSLERSQQISQTIGSPERSPQRSLERSQEVCEARGSLGRGQKVTEGRESLEQSLRRSLDRSTDKCEANKSLAQNLDHTQVFERCEEVEEEVCEREDQSVDEEVCEEENDDDLDLSSFYDDHISNSELDYFSSEFDDENIPEPMPNSRRIAKFQRLLNVNQELACDDEDEKKRKYMKKMEIIAEFQKFCQRKKIVRALSRHQTIEELNLDDPVEEAKQLLAFELMDKKLDRDYYYAEGEPQEYKLLLLKRRKALFRKYQRYANDPDYREALKNKAHVDFMGLPELTIFEEISSSEDDGESSFNDTEVPTSEEEFMSDTCPIDFPSFFVKPITRTKGALYDELKRYEPKNCDTENVIIQKRKERSLAIEKFKATLARRRKSKAAARLKEAKKLEENCPQAIANFLEEQEYIDKKLHRPFYYASNEPDAYRELLEKRRRAIRRKYEAYVQDENFRQQMENKIMCESLTISKPRPRYDEQIYQIDNNSSIPNESAFLDASCLFDASLKSDLGEIPPKKMERRRDFARAGIWPPRRQSVPEYAGDQGLDKRNSLFYGTTTPSLEREYIKLHL